MWQRFTERARRVVFFAQEEAGRLGENYVSTEHLLLGLTREPDSVACLILDKMGVPLGRIRREIVRQVARGDGRLGQEMQLTPRAKKVIDLAYNEAKLLSNNYIGTEHLLLGMIREGEGLAGRVLAKLGADLERARQEVKAIQETSGQKQPRLRDEFVQQLEALPAEQQAALYREGVPFADLPDVMRYAIEKVLARNIPWAAIDWTHASIRIEKREEKDTTRYHIIAAPTLNIDLDMG